MANPNILLLEDEVQLGRIVSETLESHGFIVTYVHNGRAGLDALKDTQFDLLVVDVMMPFLNGFDFVREVRKVDAFTPVLFLTSKTQDKDIVEGYESGGNDYLKKPFSLGELILRIKELLKRSSSSPVIENRLSLIGSYKFDLQRQELIYSSGKATKLSYKEAQLLYQLVINKNRLLERKSVLINLWGDDNPSTARTMDVFITKLRKLLSEDPSIEILNIRGYGYKLLCNSQ